MLGYANGFMRVFDLKSGQVQGVLAAHAMAVNCMDKHSDNNIVAAGGGDGRVTLLKTQPFKVIATRKADSWCEMISHTAGFHLS